MKKTHIILDETNLQISRLNSVSSGYYVQLDDITFPSEQWIDLSASVMEMWLLEMNNHFLSVQPVSILCFMDGDYEIHLQRISNHCSAANLIGPDGKVFHSANIDSLYLARQILSASSKLINALPENTCSEQIEKINELSQKLRSTIHRVTKNIENIR